VTNRLNLSELIASGLSKRSVLVAIPANDEIERIEACLAALAVQRDRRGVPLASSSFEVLVFANNCTDGTVEAASSFVAGMPQRLTVISENLPSDRANAGWARKRAMDLAAARLKDEDPLSGVILTTDADSCVAPTWISETLRAFDQGADCVAGYIDAHPAEMLRLGPAFLQRGRLEDRYLVAIAEIYARCDPRPHDPWPNHRVASGASLAVTLSAYLQIGGLPPCPVGEDSALTQALEQAGMRVRHSMDVCVSTSCRFAGRAKGGAADTMQHRHAVVDAPCDPDMEPAFAIVRRALCKGRLRRSADDGQLAHGPWAGRLGLTSAAADHLLATLASEGFEPFWRELAEISPMLSRRILLRPSDLPRQIERADMLLRHLRGATAVRADKCHFSELFEPAAA
jgi:Glycosyl transferase family 2